ncbi:MAG: hypothetical protein WKF47_04180 [Geodermatophilaceae bacterium]
MIAVGPWIRDFWAMLDLPERISVTGTDGIEHPDTPMWTYWALQEGTLGVDPSEFVDNEGRIPPVVHVDSDQPLYDDIDGSLITDQMWGIYYKPDFHFGGVQGGASPELVDGPAGQVAVDPYGTASPEFVVGEDFVRMWTSALAHCHKRFEGHPAALPQGSLRRHRRVHPGQLPGLRHLPGQRLRHRRFQPRLQDDRRRRPGRRRIAGRDLGSCWSRSGSPGTPPASCTRSVTPRFPGAERGARSARGALRPAPGRLPARACRAATGRPRCRARWSSMRVRGGCPTRGSSTSSYPSGPTTRRTTTRCPTSSQEREVLETAIRCRDTGPRDLLRGAVAQPWFSAARSRRCPTVRKSAGCRCERPTRRSSTRGPG